MERDINEAVEASVRRKLGKVELIHVSEYKRPNVLAARRRYFNHTFKSEGREVRVFSKTTLGAARSLGATEGLLQSLRFTIFTVPLFYGTAAWSGGSIATWEAVSGATHLMADAPPSVLGRLVRIAADLAASTDSAIDALPVLARRTRFMREVSDKVVQTLDLLEKAGVDVSDLIEQAKLYGRNEYRGFRRFDEMGQVLSHLDFGNGNVLHPPRPEKPVVIDWDTLSLAPPGAMLRKFAELDEKKRAAAASLYARLLAKQGRKVGEHDVHFAMCAAQGLYNFSWGCRRGVKAGRKAANAFRRGFALMKVAQASAWVPQVLPELLEA